MNKVSIFDTTLRDGEQSPGCTMSLNEKIEMALQLERLGVDVIEAGFAASSDEDFHAVKTIASALEHCTVASLCRAVKSDIDRSAEALKGARARTRCHVFLATSDIHMKYKLKMTREQVLDKTREMVAYAVPLFDEVQFSAEDATRSDRAFLIQVAQAAAAAGATIINLPDTVGYTSPGEMMELVRAVKNALPEGICIATHCHDDLGMGVANSLAAVKAGATQVECTINGIGERAGSAALEEIVMALKVRQDYYGAQVDTNTQQLYRTSKLLSTIIGVPVPPNKAIVGRNAFAHESGIHQHGVLAERSTYEIMRPEDIGISLNSMVLGKHSGRHAFEDRLNILGHHLTKEQLDIAFAEFKKLAEKKKTVNDRDIEALVRQWGREEKETYKLEGFVVNSGSYISSTACVRVNKEGTVIEKVSMGQGPIDAAFKAIDRITKLGVKLEAYTINAVTEGEDALGEVVVKLHKDGETYTGRGLSTDIFESSIKAYLNGINKIVG